MVLNKPIGGAEFEAVRPPNEQAGGVLHGAGAVAGDVKAFAVRKAQAVRGVAEQKTEEVMRFLKARPIESVLVGAAVGYLLGWLASKAVMDRRAASRRRRRSVYEL
jgi:hypothetical protein